jgi:hypothetical protein
MELILECDLEIPKALVDLISWLKEDQSDETKTLREVCKLWMESPTLQVRKQKTRQFCSNC